MENIVENNKLIAEFMGGVYVRDENLTYEPKGRWENIVIKDRHLQTYDLKYHSDWNWLMPVIKKCFDSDYDEDLNLIGDITHALVDVDIQEVHTAVVEFIKWYNLNK